jgi:hypothetical protein
LQVEHVAFSADGQLAATVHRILVHAGEPSDYVHLQFWTRHVAAATEDDGAYGGGGGGGRSRRVGGGDKGNKKAAAVVESDRYILNSRVDRCHSAHVTALAFHPKFSLVVTSR